RAALASELQSLVVLAKGLDGFGGGLESLGLQFLDRRGREGEILPDGLRQTIDGSRNPVNVRCFRFYRCGALPLQILKGGIDANLVPELGILSPYQGLRIAEFSHPAQSGGIQSRRRRQSEIVQ